MEHIFQAIFFFYFSPSFVSKRLKTLESGVIQMITDGSVHTKTAILPFLKPEHSLFDKTKFNFFY